MIHGYAELLTQQQRTPLEADITLRLGAAADTALGLMQHYLDLASLEAPGIRVRSEPVDLGDLFEELRLFAARAIGDRPIRLITSAPPHGAVLCTDGAKLRAILTEVLSNAIKFTDRGHIHIDLVATRSSTQFVVRDPGNGIAQDDMPILFEAFRQHDTDAMSSTPGRGLGLAIALRLSVLLGAELTARRSAGDGTIVTLALPMAAESAQCPSQLLH